MNADVHSLSAAYALDALDADERVEFEAHLADCADCTAEVAEFGAVAGALGDATEQAPPPHLKSAIMSQLDDVPQEHETWPAPSASVTSLTERRRSFSMAQLLSAAAAITLIAVGAIVLAGTRGGGSDFDDVVAAPDAVVTDLAGEAGTIEIVWSAELDQVAVRGEGLADLSDEQRYALWAIVDGVPVAAGLFEADGGRFQEVAAIADVDAEAWGVTIESAEGSDAPTSDIILFADV
ncbi:MAG: hypothetical protein HKN41_07260 [Ilumatobacter sp.]|nr:hypothetical protein [Ilumatobacter sp.]